MKSTRDEVREYLVNEFGPEFAKNEKLIELIARLYEHENRRRIIKPIQFSEFFSLKK